MSALHDVLHDVAFAQTRPPEHADVDPLPQEPLPLQLPAVVSWAPVHEVLPHAVPDATCSQWPLPSHLPSLPHVPFAAH